MVFLFQEPRAPVGVDSRTVALFLKKPEMYVKSKIAHFRSSSDPFLTSKHNSETFDIVLRE